jgi:hypothetical protein
MDASCVCCQAPMNGNARAGSTTAGTAGIQHHGFPVHIATPKLAGPSRFRLTFDCAKHALERHCFERARVRKSPLIVVGGITPTEFMSKFTEPRVAAREASLYVPPVH